MTKAIFYRENFISNIENIRSLLENKKTEICIPVKANGYGAGAVLVAKTAVEVGIQFFAVASVGEGIELRKAGIKDAEILLLSLCDKSEMESVCEYNISPLVCDDEYISLFEKAASRLQKKINVHLAIDTGMTRIGCFPEEASSLAKKIYHSNNLLLRGTCTHFSCADEQTESANDFTNLQFEKFMFAISEIEKSGMSAGLRHCSASSATLVQKQMQLDMVRPGIMSYGYFDGEANEAWCKKNNVCLELKPVLALATKVASIRKIPKGNFVSYNRTWQTNEDMYIATLPIGYADGLLRTLSPRLCVTINSNSYPIVGRICMDQCMVALGKNEANVKRFDDVFIFGPNNSGALQSAEKLANIAGTISYEILTNISHRVPRVLV